jgi:hypothetical protein
MRDDAVIDAPGGGRVVLRDGVEGVLQLAQRSR